MIRDHEERYTFGDSSEQIAYLRIKCPIVLKNCLKVFVRLFLPIPGMPLIKEMPKPMRDLIIAIEVEHQKIRIKPLQEIMEHAKLVLQRSFVFSDESAHIFVGLTRHEIRQHN